MTAERVPRTLGIAGTGRLGEVLATRLRDRFRTVLYDSDASAARRVATGTGTRAVDAPELVRTADAVLLCVPPHAAPDALTHLARLAAGTGHRPVFVSLATGLGTARLRTLVAAGSAAGTEVLGLKPVCQYTALAHGVPAVFVTADRHRLGLLRAITADLGTVVVGDEESVGRVNRAATKAALAACEGLARTLSAAGTDPVLVRSAIRNVLAGTALDHPPQPGNAYTRSVLDELAAERRAEPIGGAA
ncbi:MULTISPECIES: NAD(P)-binding domain-containing protein [unclassified Streptomyces]|uniref:NAD(P)-binding domain-containing protein n=1 Tax=unclassified Streptomyces TaxID=2593676 RepID=UPI002E2C2A01|nr:NAD(P)-binding domain-containing protein [Streptomyces sp. NBC_00334]